MNTLFLLMAQYDCKAVLPLSLVCEDFMHLTVEKFKQKQLSGEIDIPVIRLGTNSQKAALGIHIHDLAKYIDKQREKAEKENNQILNRR